MSKFSEILLASIFTVIGGIILIYVQNHVEESQAKTRDPAIELSNDAVIQPEQITIPRPVKSVHKKTFDIKINYIVRRKNTPHKAENIQPSDTLYSGDSYKIIFEPQQNAYVYIFQKGTSGNIFRLFPRDNWGKTTLNLNNPVKTQQRYYVPSEHKSFVLDNTKGTEIIYLLAFSEKQHDLEQTYNKILLANEKGDTTLAQKYRGQLENQLKNYRDPMIELSPDKTSVAWTESQTRYEVVRQKLEDLCDGCVNVFSFQHQ